MAVGSGPKIQALAGPATEAIDCQGRTLLPGFVDAHCHLLAAAAAVQGLDCSSPAVASIAELQTAIRRKAGTIPEGRWIRGFGYDDLDLAERRHPTRWDLDEAAPANPVRLDHRSGHATVLNSPGLRAAGVHRETPDPVDGVILRQGETGEPTGVLLEMGAYLAGRLGKLREEEELAAGVTDLSRKLLAWGITSVQDAGPNNGPERWSAFQQLQASGCLAPRVTMMAGAPQLEALLADGWGFGDGDRWLRLGHVKVVLTQTTGGLQPDPASLNEIVRRAHSSGFPVAIHAVEQEAISAAVRALGEAGPRRDSGGPRPLDRIEHCAECPPEIEAQIRGSGVMVVTQPGFVFWNGERYLENSDPSLVPWLYPIGSLARSGVRVAFGSDAPVIDFNPWPGIYAAVTGRTSKGRMLRSQSQRIGAESALEMYTLGGARAEGTEQMKGQVTAGKLADLVLVDGQPAKMEPEMLAQVRPVLTVLGGRVA